MKFERIKTQAILLAAVMIANTLGGNITAYASSEIPTEEVILQEDTEEPVMEEVMKNLLERDYIDSHREVSPLSRATDAYVLDNSDMTLHEETVWFQGLCQGKFGILE